MRKYEIASKIAEQSVRPELVIDDKHTYKINNGRAAVLMITAISEDKKTHEAEKMDKIFAIALGQEAAEYIKQIDPGMPACYTILNTIMAAIEGKTLEEVEEAQREAEKEKKQKK